MRIATAGDIARAARNSLAMTAMLPPGRPPGDDPERQALKQSERARASGVSVPTQIRLDYLARHRRDLLRLVAAEMMSLSAALAAVGKRPRRPLRALVPVAAAGAAEMPDTDEASRNTNAIPKVSDTPVPATTAVAPALTARLQTCSDAQNAAEHGALLLAGLHERLSVLAAQIDDEEWPLLQGVHDALLALADVRRRLATLVEVVEAEGQHARLLANTESGQR